MAIESVPRRVCDRPGCGQTVTEKGLVDAGLAVGRDDGPIGGVAITHTTGTDGLDLHSNRPPDLCRDCVKSLGTWWTARARRSGDADA